MLCRSAQECCFRKSRPTPRHWNIADGRRGPYGIHIHGAKHSCYRPGYICLDDMTALFDISCCFLAQR